MLLNSNSVQRYQVNSLDLNPLAVESQFAHTNLSIKGNRLYPIYKSKVTLFT
jgi:hypothetical protein